MRLVYSVLFSFIILLSCKNGDKEKTIENINSESIEILDAKLFKIQDMPDYTLLSVYSKEGKIRDTYYLIDKNKKVPSQLIGKNIIRTPVDNIVCLSTTHVAFVELLNEYDKIKAVSGSQYIFSPVMRDRIKNGMIKDVGYESALDFELLLQIKPDVVTVYDINGTISPIINKIKKFNIPVIQINEYLESSALSQAEWIRFFGELFNKRQKSKLAYINIKKEYERLQNLTETIKQKPTVLLNMPWKGTWFIPGGKSNIAKLISDAGGSYIWKDSEEKHNLPLNIEDVFLNASDADIWLNPGQARSLKDVVDTDSRLKDFKPLQNKMIFNRNNRMSETGGNDSMESGTLRPDIILKDMIKILHPDLLPEYELYYYKKLL